MEQAARPLTGRGGRSPARCNPLDLPAPRKEHSSLRPGRWRVGPRRPDGGQGPGRECLRCGSAAIRRGWSERLCLPAASPSLPRQSGQRAQHWRVDAGEAALPHVPLKREPSASRTETTVSVISGPIQSSTIMVAGIASPLRAFVVLSASQLAWPLIRALRHFPSADLSASAKRSSARPAAAMIFPCGKKPWICPGARQTVTGVPVSISRHA
jgi:hypothetical protein